MNDEQRRANRIRRSAMDEKQRANSEWRTGNGEHRIGNVNDEHRMADDYSDVPNTQYPCLFGTSEYW